MLRCSFSSIGRFCKLAYLISVFSMFKTLWMIHVNIHSHIPVKEIDFNIHLPYFIIIKSCYDKHHPNLIDLGNWRKSHITFNPLILSKFLWNQSGLGHLYITIHFSLLVEGIFTKYSLLIEDMINLGPYLVIIHGWISLSITSFHLASSGLAICSL